MCVWYKSIQALLEIRAAGAARKVNSSPTFGSLMHKGRAFICVEDGT